MVNTSTAAPEGTIESFTVVHQEVSQTLIDPPYLLAEIKLNDGLRIRCVSTTTQTVSRGSRIKLETEQFQTEDGPRLGLVFSLL